MQAKFVSVFFIGAIVAGCGSVDGMDSGEFDDVFETDEQALFADSSLLFMPAGSSNQTVISLCWDTSAFNAADSKFAEGRSDVQAAIASSWEANSWIKFKWNSSCADTDIPIKVADVRPIADRRGVTLNFTYQNYQTPRCASTRAKRQACNQALALHEIGHVLGFDHEQNRSPGGITCQGGAAPIQRDDESFSVAGDWELEPVDSASVMSYCPEGWRSTLAASDIAAVQALYGGSGNHVRHGWQVAVREGDGDYWGISGAVSKDFKTAATITRVSGAGIVQYGDKVSIEIGGKYLCGNLGSAPPAPIPIYVPPSTTWVSPRRTDGSCDWKVEGTNGGSNVDVNDAFKLHLIIEPTDPVQIRFDKTTTTLRLQHVLTG